MGHPGLSWVRVGGPTLHIAGMPEPTGQAVHLVGISGGDLYPCGEMNPVRWYGRPRVQLCNTHCRWNNLSSTRPIDGHDFEYHDRVLPVGCDSEVIQTEDEPFDAISYWTVIHYATAAI